MIRAATALLALAVLAGCADDAATGGTTTTAEVTTTSTPPTSTPATTGTTAAVAQPLPEGTLDVLVVGDSVMFDAEAAIAAALEATGAATVRNGAVFGLGLSDAAGIPFSGAADDLLEGPPVDQVVLMIGSWDHLGVQRDPDAYADEVDAALDRLSEDGRQVLVLGEPPSDPAKGEEPVRTAVNEQLAESAARVGATFLSTDAVIGDPQGRYVMTGPDGLLRKPDGRHLCPAGATRFGESVLRALQASWQLPDADPVWTLGPWRQDVRYDDPPGACPV